MMFGFSVHDNVKAIAYNIKLCLSNDLLKTLLKINDWHLACLLYENKHEHLTVNHFPNIIYNIILNIYTNLIPAARDCMIR